MKTKAICFSPNARQRWRKAICFAALLICLPAGAQETDADAVKTDASAADGTPFLIQADLQARGDYQRLWQPSGSVDEESGFKGKFLNLRLQASLGRHFSFAYRQRFNKISADNSFFDATDWLYLNYAPSDRWQISAGKQVVAVGGFEYDRAPIDLYAASEFWNHIACYQWGVSVSYQLTPTDRLLAQVCQSPFDGRKQDSYAYSLFWTGQHGLWSTLWSANLMEHRPGAFISYLSLGNRLALGKWAIEADFQNRAADHQAYFFKDCTVVGELQFRPTRAWNVFAKWTYDVNRTQTAADQCVAHGTEVHSVGGGFEFYPLLGKNQVRLHLAVAHSFGTAAEGAALADRQTYAAAGLTWNFNFLSLRHLFKK